MVDSKDQFTGLRLCRIIRTEKVRWTNPLHRQWKRIRNFVRGWGPTLPGIKHSNSVDLTIQRNKVFNSNSATVWSRFLIKSSVSILINHVDFEKLLPEDTNPLAESKILETRMRVAERRLDPIEREREVLDGMLFWNDDIPLHCSESEIFSMTRFLFWNMIVLVIAINGQSWCSFYGYSSDFLLTVSNVRLQFQSAWFFVS